MFVTTGTKSFTSGGAYSSQGVMDPVPSNLQNYCLNNLDKSAKVKTGVHDKDVERVKDWISSQPVNHASNLDIPEYMSVGSSNDDNTLLDLDEAALTCKLPKIRNIPEDISVVSSNDDNTLLDLDEVALTCELPKIRSETITPLENRLYQQELAQAAGKGSMTRVQQIEAVRNFKWGRCRVAVATSVAEEGMDVTRCSRVIGYEYVSNEIGMIQARGSASRVEDGAYYTVTAKEDVAMREKTNIRLESVMNHAVECLQQQFNSIQEALQQTLIEFQKEEKNSRELEKMKALEQPLSNDVFELRCYRCDTHAIKSTEIRIVANSHRLVISPQIWTRVTEQNPERREAFGSMQKVSAVHCKVCQQRWGSSVMYKEKKLVAISIISYMAYDVRGKSFHWIKWKKAQFKCQEMEN